MDPISEAQIIEATVYRSMILEAAGIDAGDWTDLVDRVDDIEDRLIPAQQAITGGRFYGTLTSIDGYGATQPFTMSENILYVSAFHCPQDATFNEMRIRIENTGSIFRLVRMAIYNSASNGTPSTLRQSLGDIFIGSTSGEKAQSISLTLPRGNYWLGGFAAGPDISIQSVNAGTSYGLTAVLGHLDTSGGAPRASGYRATPIVDGELPSSFGQLSTHAPIPVFWLRA